MTREEQKLAGAIAKLDPARGFVDNFDSFIDFALFPFLANPTEKEVKAFNECKRNERYLQALQDLGGTFRGLPRLPWGYVHGQYISRLK